MEQLAGVRPPSSSSKVTPVSSCIRIGGRELFSVELRPGETTVVSWKKLVKDVNKSNEGTILGPDPTPANPRQNLLESRMLPGKQLENKEVDVPAGPNRFNAVIEKIERLYMGKDSSDEEDDLQANPDDDQYDTEDSFIDDTELDEYFEVDKAAMKHDGFFINRGKLDIIESTIVPDPQPKKKRRKDITGAPGESRHGLLSNKHANPGKFTSGRTGALLGKDSSSPNQNLGIASKHNGDVKGKNPSKALGMSSKIISGETETKSDPSLNIKLLNSCTSASPAETKDTENTRPAVVPVENHTDKSNGVCGSSDASRKKYNEKNANPPSKKPAARVVNNFDSFKPLARKNDSKLVLGLLPKEENGHKGSPGLNVSEGKPPVQPTRPLPVCKNDGSTVKPKTSVLEKTIRELEKMVAESRPPTQENQDAVIRKRLPREIKLKLDKVARVAAAQGKVTNELINRLNGILGDLIQLRTLKRNMKAMINSKQERENMLQHLKKEVCELIKTRVSSLKPKTSQLQAGESNDFQEDKGSLNVKCGMDVDLEEKICDLYDFFVDGLDEDVGSHVRKLYAELAQMWPTGLMDNHGIRNAISRAKARRKVMNNRHKDDEKIKRKKILGPRPEEAVQAEVGSVSQAQCTREKPSTDTCRPVSDQASKQNIDSSAATNQTSSPQRNSDLDRIKQEKNKRNSNLNGSMERPKVGADGALIKKKVKRKPEEESKRTHSTTDLNPRPSKMSKQASGFHKTLDIQLNAPLPSSGTA